MAGGRSVKEEIAVGVTVEATDKLKENTQEEKTH